jgi:hypothetical protein
MDYLTELRQQGFHQTDGKPDSAGRVEFNSDLFRGTDSEVTVQVYAVDQEELEREVMPTLEALLPWNIELIAA